MRLLRGQLEGDTQKPGQSSEPPPRHDRVWGQEAEGRRPRKTGLKRSHRIYPKGGVPVTQEEQHGVWGVGTGVWLLAVTERGNGRWEGKDCLHSPSGSNNTCSSLHTLLPTQTKCSSG